MKRLCSWCAKEKGDIGLSTDIGGKPVSFHLGADCFYRLLEKNLGKPMVTTLDIKKSKNKEDRVVN